MKSSIDKFTIPISESDFQLVGVIEGDKSMSQPKQAAQENISVNYGYLTLYVVILALNSIAVSWTTGGNNQTANVIAAKLDWNAAETRLHNTAINFAAQIGKSLGAIVGGKLIQESRRDVFMKYNFLAMVSTLLMQFLSFPMLVFGKFTNGFVVTVAYIAAIKMINETVPVA